MTIDIVDIEQLRKINTADGFIGCLMEHVLCEKTGWDAPGKKEESRKNNKGVCIELGEKAIGDNSDVNNIYFVYVYSTTRREGDSPGTGSIFPVRSRGGKGRIEGLWGGWEIRQKGNMGLI